MTLFLFQHKIKSALPDASTDSLPLSTGVCIDHLSVSVCLCWRSVFLEDQRRFFEAYSVSLYLSVGNFNPFTFKRPIDK